ncbi:MAG: HAMP domain-containing protein [Deltaproteobacteria bacterium]|nr:HAMP domain-containing protein [Deltaproteobacteria bacterium]
MRLGISARLTLGATLLVLAIVAGLAYLRIDATRALHRRVAAEKAQQYRAQLDARGATTTQVFAQALRPLLIGNQDEEIAALVALTVAQDPSLAVIDVLGRDKSVIVHCAITRGHPGACAPSTYAAHAPMREASWPLLEQTWRSRAADPHGALLVSLDQAELALFAAPVFLDHGSPAAAVADDPGEQRLGYLVFGYDLAPLAQLAAEGEAAAAAETSDAVIAAITAGAVFGAIGLVLAILFGVGMARPIRRLASAAQQLARGDWNARVDVRRSDELGQLAASFRDMAEAVRARDEQLRAHAEQLEATVAERTRHLALILDSTGDALVPVGLDGAIAGQVSAAARLWFGAPREGTPVWTYLACGDAARAAAFQLGIQQILEDFLPFDVAIDQLPRRIERGDRVLELGFRQVIDDGRFQQLLVVVADVTRQVAAERGEALARELQGIVAQALRDPVSFTRFVAETEGLFAQVRATPEPAIRLRGLHTLKGNSAIYGFATVSAQLHALESALVEDPAHPLAAELDAIEALWRERRTQIAAYLPREVDGVSLSREEHRDLVARLERGENPRALAAMVRGWTDVPAERLLSQLGEHARQIAERRGKQVEIEVEADGLRVDVAATSAFWGNLVHVVRNAVDHGLEAPDVRREHGKSAVGHLRLRARRCTGGIEVAIADDGGGIDWDRVRDRARSMGVPATGPRELEAALFADGLSTAACVDEVSGRGVGLAAVRAACEAGRGHVAIHSVTGEGTTVELRIPQAHAS